MVVASTFAMASVGGAEKKRFDICTGNDWAGAEGQKKSMCRVSSPRKTLLAKLIINATCCPVLRRGSRHFPRLNVGWYLSL